MTGRVQCFVPAARRGIVLAESGQELSFVVPAGVGDLQGGDIVEFELVGDGQPCATNVTLRHRWADLLNEQHRPLVNQFHRTIQIRT